METKNENIQEPAGVTAPDSIQKILPDEVVNGFLNQYVEAAKDRVASANNGNAKWRILRAVCSDVAQFRQTAHQNERLGLWKERLKADIASKTKCLEDQLVKLCTEHPELEAKYFPKINFSHRQKEAEMRAILGLEPRHPAEVLRDAIYDVMEARKALGIPEDGPLPTRDEADDACDKWKEEHGEPSAEEVEAERVRELLELNPGKTIEEIDAALEKMGEGTRRRRRK